MNPLLLKCCHNIFLFLRGESFDNQQLLNVSCKTVFLSAVRSTCGKCINLSEIQRF